jgi:hypothetical protein
MIEYDHSSAMIYQHESKDARHNFIYDDTTVLGTYHAIYGMIPLCENNDYLKRTPIVDLLPDGSVVAWPDLRPCKHSDALEDYNNTLNGFREHFIACGLLR